MGYLTLRQDQDQLIQKVGHSNSRQVTANFSPSKPTEVSSNQYSGGKTPNLTKLSLLPVHVLRSCAILHGPFNWLGATLSLAGPLPLAILRSLACWPSVQSPLLNTTVIAFPYLTRNSGKPHIGKYSTNNCFNTQGSPKTITSCLTNLMGPTLKLIYNNNNCIVDQ